MVSLKCKMCGGALEFESGATVGTCEYCGSKQTLPKTQDDVIGNLFNRANNMRLKCEFDKAMSIYEKIVEKDDSESEAHWGIVLCRYGIEYVEDPQTKKRIPTCHRTLYEPVTKDPDFQAAIDYSDAFQQTIYEKEAKEIDKIQKEILAIVQNEAPFDVFICYKETDENGKRTKDSVLANDIYHQLIQEDFKVFYAAITLEDKLGHEYEPYIFAALNTAKVMLVIGSQPEYFNAVWVKNEWSRFLSLMKTNRSKILIPCYKDMDAYELPEEFSHLQAQDMSKIGFINDIIRGIKKLIAKDTPKTDNSASAGSSSMMKGSSGSMVPSLFERAYIFLDDEKWDDADAYFEKVLDIEPRNAEAYFGKLMAELKVNKKEDIPNCSRSFRESDNFNKILKFGDEKLNKEIKDILSAVETKEKYANLSFEMEKLSINNIGYKEKAEQFNNIGSQFKEIGNYLDAEQLSKKCFEEARIANAKEEKLQKNTELMAIIEELLAYKIGYSEYARISKERNENLENYKNAITILQNNTDKIRTLNENKKTYRELVADRNSLTKFAFGKKKELDNDLDRLEKEISFLLHELRQQQEQIPSIIKIDMCKCDFNEALSMVNILKKKVALYGTTCPLLEEIYNKYQSILTLVDSVDIMEIGLVGKYIMANRYINEGDYISAYLLLEDLGDFCDSAAKFEALKKDHESEISILLRN